MYDRRIEGDEHVFGNQGALYKNAMTWWDHETESVWSQVTGEALYGPLRGARLRPIPAAIETWEAWRAAHPHTLVLETGGVGGEPVTRDFVIGIRIRTDSAAFRFPHVVQRGVVNDSVGGVPVAVFARHDRVIRVYARRVGDRIVDLQASAGRLVDLSSGTAWNAVTGQGMYGPLADEPLATVAWVSSYDWAWVDFYPNSRIVG